VASVEKIAVSVDRQLLRSAERLREATGESRSALVSRALSLLVAEREAQDRVAEYVEAYRRRPERRAEIDQARTSARRSLEALEWDDE
jgi:metal-responsive CopG/Arc/MetJ family transcriptional regulator